MTKTAITGCIVLSLFLVSCGAKNPREAVLGKWATDDGKSIEFYQDGTVIHEKRGKEVTAKYSFLDDSHMRFDAEGFVGAMIGPIFMDFSISGDDLTLKERDRDDATVYRRVKNK